MGAVARQTINAELIMCEVQVRGLVHITFNYEVKLQNLCIYEPFQTNYLELIKQKNAFSIG